MANPTLTDINRQQLRWRVAGPIRQYREANGITLAGMASLIGVSMFAIQMWEAGNNKPSDDNMAKLRAVIGDGFEDAWDAWRAERPTVAMPPAGGAIGDTAEAV